MKIPSLSSSKPTPDGNPHEGLGYSSRKPQRVTITVPCRVYAVLLPESDSQGRSLLNLASVWLE